MNPPKCPDFNIIKAVWDHLDREQRKGSRHPKKSFGMSFKKPGELFLKTIKKMTESWSESRVGE